MQVPYVDIDYQWITDSLIITPGDYPSNCVNEGERGFHVTNVQLPVSFFLLSDFFKTLVFIFL